MTRVLAHTPTVFIDIAPAETLLLAAPKPLLMLCAPRIAGLLPARVPRWIQTKDGDADVRELYHRHYSYRPYKDGRQPKLFVGPGFKIVLKTKNKDAAFVWRKFISGDGQQGINCAIFRNESDELSSALIVEAMDIAKRRWPGERMYTYVNPRKVESRNPGYCFKMAGWQQCGVTKRHKLLIFEVAA